MTLECTKCEKELTKEHLGLINKAMNILMSPIGRFLGASDNYWLCEKCFEKENDEDLL